MVSQEIVTPVPGFCRDRVTGVQRIYNNLKRLDPGFRRNDGKAAFPAFCEIIKIEFRHTMSEESGNPHQ